MFEIVVVEAQQFRRDFESNCLAFTCLEEYFLKSFQLFHRAGDASHQVTYVELHHFSTVALAGIGNGNCGGNGTVLSHSRCTQGDVAVLESSVREAVTKGVQRLIVHIQVAAAELLEPFAFLQGTTGILVVVEQRYLPYILGECHRQLAAWVHISEEHVPYGISGFASSEPYVQYGRHVLLFPSQC